MKALNKQALRNTADRDWFESWFKSDFHPDKTGPYIKDQLFFAIQAARKPLLDELEAAEKRNAELQSENAYIRNRYKELDLLIGKNILVMQAAIIEWQATGDAKNGLAWIYNTLFGPGELPDESEKDAQAYFDLKYAPIDEELMALHKWFWEQSEAERAAAGIGVKGE
ncbi:MULTISPECIES: ead/Ea22-like family protein [Enterobacteriaceae]|uniref:ead/Ea22-like family protein n=1 Tax=Enterobacteriaceae TaxID=543 RepID=UPI0023B213CE|nr:ead/Ea22-like family protein [Citrobacter cronae]MDE9718836.1 ead/Ea22-like family protein [Citrobacter cronae]